MQYFSVDYSRSAGMEWLTPTKQKYLYLASISTHEITKKLAYSKIAELSARS